MCFVFGEPKEPEEEAVQCIEDIIKAHLAELVRRTELQTVSMTNN